MKPPGDMAIQWKPERYEVIVSGQVVELTVTEARIFAMLWKRPGCYVSAAELLAPGQKAENVKWHMWNIRKKLGKSLVRGSWGKGYMLDDVLQNLEQPA